MFDKVFSYKPIQFVVLFVLLQHLFDPLSLPFDKEILSHPIAQFVVTFIMYMFYSNNPIEAGIVAAGIAAYRFIMSMLFAESMENVKFIRNVGHIYPGCEKATPADILAAFDGNEEKMNTYFKNVGPAQYLGVNDKTAPYIATLLVYTGVDIPNVCAALKMNNSIMG